MPRPAPPQLRSRGLGKPRLDKGPRQEITQEKERKRERRLQVHQAEGSRHPLPLTHSLGLRAEVEERGGGAEGKQVAQS